MRADRTDAALARLDAYIAPPYSLEAEQSVIGALLIDSTAWPRIAVLTASDFYQPNHQVIFRAVAELCDAGKVADLLTVGDLLKTSRRLDDIGGLAALGTLARDTPSAANIEAYAAIVRERSLRRRLQDFGTQVARLVREGSDREPGEIVAMVQERLTALQAAARSGKGLVSSADLATEFIDDLDRRRERAQGLRIGLADFDALTNGLEPGDLVVMAGRPGMGKTALLVAIAAHVSGNQSVAVFSAEMPARQLMRRCIALLGSIPQGRLRRADQLTDEDWSQISVAATAVSERRLWIDDTALPTLGHVRGESLGLKARTGLDLVIIDYVQLVQGHGANRYEQLREVAYGLKALAKDLAVPVILLAQLNRGVEGRDSRRPNASDLRDSGAIEEAADIVGLLYSESQYVPDFPMPDVLECRIAKHRNGERGECLWSFNGAMSRITVLDDGDRAQYRRLRAQQDAPRTRKASNDL